MLVSTLFAVVAVQAAPVPPPPGRIVADCDHPVYATESLICADPALGTQEMAVLDLWRVVVARGMAAPPFEGQAEWFARRALCAFESDHRGCVVAANSARTTALSGLIGEPAPQVSEEEDARVAGTPFNARSVIRCSGPGLPPNGLCEVGVIRRQDQSADVVVLGEAVAGRTLIFDPEGQVSTPGARSERLADDWIRVLVEREVYEVPTALLWGG